MNQIGKPSKDDHINNAIKTKLYVEYSLDTSMIL